MSNLFFEKSVHSTSFPIFQFFYRSFMFVELDGRANNTHGLAGVSRLWYFFAFKNNGGNEITCNLIWSDIILSSVDGRVAVESTGFLQAILEQCFMSMESITSTQCCCRHNNIDCSSSWRSSTDFSKNRSRLYSRLHAFRWSLAESRKPGMCLVRARPRMFLFGALPSHSIYFS